VRQLLAQGEQIGAALSASGLVALGEVGIGNTTVAAALTASVLGLTAEATVGLGAGADTDMLARKAQVVTAALTRWSHHCGVHQNPARDDAAALVRRLVVLGGPEFALLTGVVLGSALGGAVIVLDGLATSVAALLAVRVEPAVAAHLVAGQRSREHAHPAVLQHLGLQPLLDLRLAAGEGVGAALACQLLFTGLQLRARTARTQPSPPRS